MSWLENGARSWTHTFRGARRSGTGQFQGRYIIALERAASVLLDMMDSSHPSTDTQTITWAYSLYALWSAHAHLITSITLKIRLPANVSKPIKLDYSSHHKQSLYLK